MLQINFIRKNKTKVTEGLNKRNLNIEGGIEAFIDELLEMDDKRKSLQQELDNNLAEVNANAKLIGELVRKGDKQKAEEAKKTAPKLKELSKKLRESLSKTEELLQENILKLPNLPAETVAFGKGAEDNEVLLEDGTKPSLYKGALPHWDLATKYNLIDFELGTKITGAGFPVYKDRGARLQRSLINFFLDEASKAAYVEAQPPILVNEDSAFGTGQLPDKEGQMYFVNQDNLFLIPTSEVPVTNFYRNIILTHADLPVKHCAYTPCFRREAGSYGAHVRGLNRLHQFDKVEIVQITDPEKSYETLEEMSLYVQSLLKKLELPYRVLRLCGGDMGFASALTYDMEVWSAAQERWLEVSSASNFETFQSARLKLRFRSSEGKIELAHTLNASALALPRIVAALLENNQSEEGIKIPEILRPYTGFDYIR